MKKKAVSLLLSLVMVLSMCLPANALEYVDTVIQDNLVFYLYDNGTAIVLGCYEPPQSVITIPSTVNGYAVTAIANRAFQTYPVVQFNLPETLVYIGENAFLSCPNLETINIPDSVEYIGLNAFADTPVLDKNVKNGIAYLDHWLIWVDENYTGPLQVKSGTVGIAAYAVSECTRITTVSLPASTKYVGDFAFYGCSLLYQTNLPANLAYLGSYAFEETELLKSLYQNGTAYLDKWLLAVNTGFTGHLEVPYGTVGIAAYAAADCAGLTGVTLPATVQYIGSGAFVGCSNLKEASFLGNPPASRGDAYYLYFGIFYSLNLTVQYPENSGAWDTQALSDLWLLGKGRIDWKPCRFPDLPTTAWYTSYCYKAAELGLMSGVGGNRFDPNGTTSRAMFVQILYSMMGKPAPTIENPFQDVPEGQWYTNAVLWAYENGVTGGTSPTTFSPDENLTREQIAMFLYSLSGKPAVTGDLSKFADTDKVSDWAVNAMLWATQNGFISGSAEGGKLYLNPSHSATRAQTATIMVNFYQAVNAK